MTRWTIREATVEDVEVLLAIIHAAFEEYRGRLDPPSGAHDETAESLSRKLSGAQALLAFRDRVAAGCVFYETASDHVYFSRLAVLAPFRRQGLGQTLVEEVEARAWSRHRRRVRLGVRVALARQRAYYERLGYHEIDAKTHLGYGQPTYLIMEKTLAGEPPA